MPGTDRVLIRHPDTRDERTVAEAAVRFFPAYERVPQVTPAAKSTSKHKKGDSDSDGG